jgi:predicted O-linked N-acetylglucosamine transferase (SPINDLY family)
LAELVAADLDRYVDLAVQLAQDAEHRARIRETMKRNSAALFSDVDAVNALARLLLESRAPP